MTTSEGNEMNWNDHLCQTVVIPGARQGVTDTSQRRFAAAIRREAKKRGLNVTVRIASSQRVAHVRILG